ncbi:uncharacterized protein MELLADRAFT_101580 [Melampsora larici-populina 98AG31]|uniref:Uncharacterized protein n=1 Tax=Melampsora larici-populina (strain 98AG31 / pathotype 3-4-7) TaxID=747676 RepID=F4R6B0_MELLP|nr:uncharacterized protein MELLADRAFT_101580 [Melampsora larici-populina 98AG31]EGG12493.1 hypothetical protein MELLADRAFT_101580 [Melampsora larici-populina 98AG31]
MGNCASIDIFSKSHESIVFASVSVANCVVAFASTTALSRQSWSALKSISLLWALVLGLSLVRGIAMLVILSSRSSAIMQLCGSATTTDTDAPAIIRSVVSSTFKGFTARSLVIDGILQAYAALLVVRNHQRMTHYKSIQSQAVDGMS